MIVIGVALLFQYNLKLNKLSQVQWIQDINDEEVTYEYEEGPIALMNDIFPFAPKLIKIEKGNTTKNVIVKTEYVRRIDDDENEPVYKRTGVISPGSPENSSAPIVPITDQIQLSLRDSSGLRKPNEIVIEMNEPRNPISQKRLTHAQDSSVGILEPSETPTENTGSMVSASIPNQERVERFQLQDNTSVLEEEHVGVGDIQSDETEEVASNPDSSEFSSVVSRVNSFATSTVGHYNHSREMNSTARFSPAHNLRK